MSSSSYKQQIESTKSQIEYLESLPPEQRRVAIIKMRKDQARSEIFVLILVAIMGLSFFAFAMYSWVVEYNISLMSSLGVVGAAILNIVAFRYFQSSNSESANKILSDEFTDEDILAYFRERERNDQQAFEQWNKNKYWLALIMVILIALYFVSPVRDFVVMLFSGTLSMFLIGFVISALIQHRNQRNRYGS
jgi:hypothetical protein